MTNLLINDFVFVAHVVPSAAAAPRLAAVVTHVAVVATASARFVAAIASVAPIRVFFEQSIGEMQWGRTIVSHVVATGIGATLFVVLEDKAFAGTGSLGSRFSVVVVPNPIAIAAIVTHETR